MPIIRNTSSGHVHVPGIYKAVQAMVIRRREAVDPRPGAHQRPRSPQYLAARAGEPIRVQGRDLRGHSLPTVMVRRDQALDGFLVNADDTIDRSHDRGADS